MRSPIEVRVPKENVNDDTVTVLEWFFKDDDRVEKNAKLVKVDTSKTVFEITSPSSGFLKIIAKENEEVAVGSILCYLGEDLEEIEKLQREQSTGIENKGARSKSIRFSAGARRLIEQYKLDQKVFGNKKLIREKDVIDYLDTLSGTSDETHKIDGIDKPLSNKPRRGPSVKTSSRSQPKTKRTEILHLRTAASNTITSSVTMLVPSKGITLASRQNPEILGRLSATIIFEVARVLKQYPEFNGFYSEGREHLYEEINIGFALDADKGLKVPVIHAADKKNIQEIMNEKRECLVQYIEDKLPVERMAGATFTVTDLFNEGVFEFQPLLNEMQSAILGVGSEYFIDSKKPVGYNLTLVFDHQMANGRRAAGLLIDIRDRLIAHESAHFLTRDDDDLGVEEPYCSFCLKPLSELQAIDRRLLQTVINTEGEIKLICELCLHGW